MPALHLDIWATPIHDRMASQLQLKYTGFRQGLSRGVLPVSHVLPLPGQKEAADWECHTARDV
eukprot:scaffold2882_cov434-Prasinococcus_capsulatus_cf.AAC.13